MNVNAVNFPVIDIHCHPAMKVNFGHIITKKHSPPPDLVPTGMHVDIPGMQAGNVRVAVSVHHIVERGLIDVNRNPELNIAVELIGLLNPSLLANVTEDINHKGITFRNTLSSIQVFKTAIQTASAAGVQVALPENYSQFTTALTAGKTIFIHSIEGAHHLGSDKLPEAQFVYEANIDQLARAGVCQITIAHFFENIIVSSQGGIPPHSKHLLHYDEANVPKNFVGLNPHLGGIGEKLVNKLLDVGIIIDLVHCPPEARTRIYAINAERVQAGKPLRPLVFSHTGIQSCIDPTNNFDPADNECLPSDDEVREIIKCRGVIGVIFMNYWLVGKEEDNSLKHEIGLPLVIKTIRTLKEIGEGSCDHIAIGSDLDGFSQVPDDLVTSAAMPSVPKALKEAGFTDEEIRKICYENYLRVLQLGWGEDPTLNAPIAFPLA